MRERKTLPILRLLAAIASIAISAGCSKDRAASPVPSPVYDRDVAPLLAERCASCHGDTAPAAGWSATSYLGTIACVAPSGAPATVTTSRDAAPILKALAEPPHEHLLSASERRVLEAWVTAGAPAFASDVHTPGIVDPRAPDFHGATLRKQKYGPMLDANDRMACGRCHEGAPAKVPGVTHAAPGAPACTSCHTEKEGVLACTTCHGTPNGHAYPPRDACFFPGDRSKAGAHAAHVDPSGLAPSGLACSTCHPVPSSGPNVLSGAHANGTVDVAFDPARVAAGASYDPQTGACTVSCHAQGGARQAFHWSDEGPLGCNDCHRAPPSNHYPGPCSACHAEADATGTSLRAGGLHMNGKVDLGDGSGTCGACHGTNGTPWPSTGAHQAHANPTLTVAVDCGDCHVVPNDVHAPGHLDASHPPPVTLSGRAIARGSIPAYDGARCTNVACHGAALPDPAAAPAWRDTSGAEAKCGACHGIPPSEHTASTSCDRSDCHGGEVTLDSKGLPLISSFGRTLHVNGAIDVARGP